MADREVTLKLGVKAAEDIDAPLKKIRAGWQGISREQDDFNKKLMDAVAKHRDQEERLREQAKLKEELKKYGINELTMEEKVNKMLKERVESYRLMKRYKEELAKIPTDQGGTMGQGGGPGIGTQLAGLASRMSGLNISPGTLGVAGFGLMANQYANYLSAKGRANTYASLGGAGQVQYESPEWSEGLNGLNGFFTQTGTRRGRRLANEEANPSLLRQALGLATTREQNINSGAYDPQLNLRSAELSIQMARARRGLEMGSAQELYGVGGERASAESRLRLGATTAGAQFGISRRITGEVETALATAGGRAGITREAEQADILRRGGLQMGLEREGVEYQRQVGLLGDRQKFVDTDTKALRDKLAAAQHTAEMSKPQGMGYDNATQEDRQRRLAQYEDALSTIVETRTRLRERESEQVKLQEQREQMMVQHGQARLQMLNRERDALTGIVQSERAKRQGAQEHIGLMQPHQQQYLLNIARRASTGQKLNFFEIQQAQQHPDIFGDVLAKQGREQGAPIMAELMKLMPSLGAREKEASEARVSIENKIAAEIKINEESFAQQIQNELMPKLNEAVASITAKLGEELQRLLVQMRRQSVSLTQ